MKAWIQVGLFSLLAVGCAGRLEDPSRFLGSDGGGVNTDGGGPTACEGFDVPVDLFQTTCGNAGCHAASGSAGGLDLVSSGVATRLIHQPSHTCSGLILVTSPDSGFLFDKLEGKAACGFQMPLGKAPLSAPEMGCLELWLGEQMDGGAGS